MLWTFTVSTGFFSEALAIAQLPSDMFLHAAEDRLFVLDLAGRSLKGLDLLEFALTSSYY